MARTVLANLTRLSNLIRQIEEKRQLCAELQKNVEPLIRSDLVKVTGEASRINELQQLLRQAMEEVTALQQAEKREQAAAHLDKAEEVLSDIRWELVEDLTETVQSYATLEQEAVRKYQAQLAEWEARIVNLRRLLDVASRVRAPVNIDTRRFIEIEAQYKQAERALEEGSYAKATELFEKLDKSPAKDVAFAERISEETTKAAENIRQAELMLLCGPVDERSLYHYTLLLRTPSEPGTHGINIQDSCTLVKNDRDEMCETMRRLTAAIDSGLVRSLRIRQMQSEGASPETAEQAAGGEPGVAMANAVTGAATQPAEGAPPAAPANVGAARGFVLDSEADGDDIPPAEALNDLIKDVGDFMFKLFIPDQMQSYLKDSKSSLTITTNDLVLPWELMSFRGENESSEPKILCLERPVARMPMGRALPRRHTRTPLDRRLSFLLIYADPKNNLPEARNEVQKIYTKLKDDWGDQVEIKVLSDKEATGRELNRVLRRDTYDVIHFAGHAFFDREDADLSGLLLHGEEHFLAQKVRRLLEGRPLVFLNACESGSVINEKEGAQRQPLAYLQKEAEGLASAFIYGGAVGFLGSLWPIYDDPAADFAISFYNNILRGHIIGEAVRLARREVRELHPNQITWAAFVLYGDPTHNLYMERNRDGASLRRMGF